MKKMIFVSGLPRSGSTLLMNILNQNPRFYSTSSSPVADILRGINKMFKQNSFAQSMADIARTERKIGMMRGALSGAFEKVKEEVIFDKNRGWPAYLELATTLLEGQKPLVIVCVRDLRDILASFEKLHRETMKTGLSTQMENAPVANASALGRARFMMLDANPVGYAKTTVCDAITRGWQDNMFFVEYEALTRYPKESIDAIYSFIDEPQYDHDYENVEMTTPEDDSVHGFVGLHTVRKEVRPQPPQAPIVFDDQVLDSPFWRELKRISKFWRFLV